MWRFIQLLACSTQFVSAWVFLIFTHTTKLTNALLTEVCGVSLDPPPLLSAAYVCIEVDGYEFYNNQTQTHSSISSLSPHWDEVRIRFLKKIKNCAGKESVCYFRTLKQSVLNITSDNKHPFIPNRSCLLRWTVQRTWSCYVWANQTERTILFWEKLPYRLKKHNFIFS